METLLVPKAGTPEVIESRARLAKALLNLSNGTGPIAIDAERASGYRYSSRAYLIQLFRRGGGLHLIDPIPLEGAPEIAELDLLISENESVIHASSQDLECLREFGINPKLLFDTELGARIAGCERVGLGSLCETLLQIQIAKEHSAVDWSHRPLKSEWLDYAALDVEVLLDIRDKVAELLENSGKLAWAMEEFANSLNFVASKKRKDPWRRTSGMHQIKSRYELALVRELWLERDRTAKEIDIAPGRLLSDAVIVDLARHKPKDFESMLSLPILKEKIRNDQQRQYLQRWWQTLKSAYQLDQDEWPEMRARGEGLPPPRIWREKFPRAAIHLQHARLALSKISTELQIPLENLIAPETVRKIAFDEARERFIEFSEDSKQEVALQLHSLGARNWQVELVCAPLAQSLAQQEPPEIPPSEE